jgi:GT2 family glycosyltransferase
MIHARAVTAHMALGLPPGSGRTFVSELTTPAAKRNHLIDYVLRRQDLEWLYFSDDDMVPPRDTVMRLLADDLDLVGALYAGVVRDGVDGEPVPAGTTMYAPECGSADGHGPACSFTTLRTTLTQHDWVGAGALLVRRRVLEALSPGPWFVSDATGENEDLAFCARARSAGFAVWLDGRVEVPHLQTIPVTMSAG